MYNWIDICYGIGCRDIYPFSFSSTSHLLTMSSLTFYTFLCPSFIFPPFFYIYVCLIKIKKNVYLFVTFDLLLISPFYTSSMLFLLFSFFLLIFFPSQPLSSSSLLFYLLHFLLLFLPYPHIWPCPLCLVIRFWFQRIGRRQT